ncbi:MAG TPA: site-2 protease family protein [Levilinea sp.]|nr:site-2 protease family protein [Levilinea sp.]
MLGLDIPTLLSRIIILIVSLSTHEFAHAATADALGDDTPRLNGRLTLNPAAHLDLMGSLMLLIAGFGWARPVPINPYALQRRTPAGVMMVSLAGPASNLLLAILAAIPIRMGLVTPSFANTGPLPSLYLFLLQFIAINLLLMVFNLIPLAPLDGEKIAGYFLPPPVASLFDTIRPYGPLILLAILFVGPMVGLDIFGWIVWPVVNILMRLLGV